MNPQDLQPGRYYLGVSRMKLGRYREAKPSSFNAPAREIDPTYAQAFAAEAQALDAAGDAAAAAQVRKTEARLRVAASGHSCEEYNGACARVSESNPLNFLERGRGGRMGWIENRFEQNFIITTVDQIFNWARKSSLWPLTFGLACCAIEMIASTTSRFDMARFGAEVFRPSPRQSDLMIVAGTVTLKMAPVLKRIWEQMPDPKWCISMGACSSVGGPSIPTRCFRAWTRSFPWMSMCGLPPAAGKPLLCSSEAAGED